MLFIEAVYFLPALFLSYWIFWMLIRVPVINTLFSITTLTHYYRRFHEPDTRLRELADMEQGAQERETKA